MSEAFSEKTVDFMWRLALNNEKPWFDAHRDEYEEYLKKPFTALAKYVASEMAERFPRENLKLHISRIYRDARRLHGRGPFKEHLWFSLKSCGGLLEGPTFWFEIGARDYSCGMGYYDASSALMDEHRRRIEADPAPLERLARRLSRQTRFTLDGDEYKRPKGDVGKLLNPWYNRKYIALAHTAYPDEELFSPSLGDMLVRDFEWLMPFYKYLMTLHSAEIK